MGSFWGSIHFKTIDREAVRQAAISVAAARQIRLLIGPEIDGWVAVYPQDHGQDDAVSRDLASACPVPAFHLILHDDDVLAYHFFRDGKHLDEYTSAPGYFSDADRSNEEQLIGTPSLYSELLTKPEAEVREILIQSTPETIALEPAFSAMEKFSAFAAALGIQNADTSYEYFEEGERHNLTRWREIEHIPDRGTERKNKRDAIKVITRQIEALKKRGLLLAAYSGRKNDWPFWADDPLGNGFFLGWTKVPVVPTTPIYRLSPPWPKKPMTLDLAFSGTVAQMATSHSGRWLLAPVLRGMERSLQLWDLTTQTLIRDLGPIPGFRMTFTPDDRHLILVDHDAVTLIAIPSGDIAYTFAIEGTAQAVMHPSGQYLLVDHQLNVQLYELVAGNRTRPRTLFFGGKNLLAAGISDVVTRQFESIDLDEYERKMRGQFEKTLFQVLKQLKKSLRIEANKDIEDQVRNGTEVQFQATLERFRKLKSGEAVSRTQGAERMREMRFSADGTLLFCATDAGVRVYEWERILESGEDILHPKFQHSTPVTYPNGWTAARNVSSVVEDRTRNRLFFGGEEGVLYALDLITGGVTPIVEMPEGSWITDLRLNADQSAIAAMCRSEMGGKPRGVMPTTLYIWKLP